MSETNSVLKRYHFDCEKFLHKAIALLEECKIGFNYRDYYFQHVEEPLQLLHSFMD